MSSMSMFGDFAEAQAHMLDLKNQHDEECYSCPKCGGQWFEEKSFSKFLKNFQLVVGQNTPTKPGSVPFHLLVCVCCDYKMEPPVVNQSRDLAGESYNDFLDTVEGKNDTRPEAVAKREETAKTAKEKDPMTTEAGPRLTLPPLKVSRGLPGITPKET